MYSSRLLDKQIVTCPNSDSCTDEVQRGNLDDHLKYRCSGTLVACQYAGAGCEFRGPKKAMNKHHGDCQFKKQGKVYSVVRIVKGQKMFVVPNLF